MAQIHEFSVVDPNAQLADDVVVGPFCVIGPNVKIGAGTVLKSHVNIHGDTVIGERNVIYPNASIGCDPQDKKYAGEPTKLVIGDDNVIREHVTISIGTTQDEGITIVGNRNLFMANAHVAHDCVVGDDTILANNVALAGHTVLGNRSIMGGQAAIHQFGRIGELAMVGGGGICLMDVPPFVICNGNPATPHGLNVVGLRRAGYGLAELNAFKAAYKAIYRDGLTIAEAAAQIDKIIEATPQLTRELTHMRDFITTSKRGIIRP